MRILSHSQQETVGYRKTIMNSDTVISRTPLLFVAPLSRHTVPPKKFGNCGPFKTDNICRIIILYLQKDYSHKTEPFGGWRYGVNYEAGIHGQTISHDNIGSVGHTCRDSRFPKYRMTHPHTLAAAVEINNFGPSLPPNHSRRKDDGLFAEEGDVAAMCRC
ncbi:hypothetical protein CDAR_599471 [Caerostris darwini]|uniref:Uncharacterized protein n=1 Tax=Caerostris darwini TaxID=1538125 RepID=A0AAV4NWL7_9ARAC|nr:hypothetical protein CDAR_599471 [Caerostris darwini]